MLDQYLIESNPLIYSDQERDHGLAAFNGKIAWNKHALEKKLNSHTRQRKASIYFRPLDLTRILSSCTVTTKKEQSEL